MTLVGVLSFPLVRLVRGGEVYTLVPNLQVDAGSYDALAQEVLRTRSLSAIVQAPADPADAAHQRARVVRPVSRVKLDAIELALKR